MRITYCFETAEELTDAVEVIESEGGTVFYTGIEGGWHVIQYELGAV